MSAQDCYKINATFKDNSRNEFNLYPISIDESSDDFRIITQVRHPSLKRGCIGDLMFSSKGVLDNEPFEDIHRDVLLSRIEVWSEELDEPTEWRYVFLKN